MTVQQEGVATSPQSQQEMLATMDRSLARLHEWLRDTSGERAALVTQRDALLGRIAA